jgi:hypothetical protein
MILLLAGHVDMLGNISEELKLNAVTQFCTGCPILNQVNISYILMGIRNLL